MTPAFIVWRDEFSVGATALDDQHKQILDVINALYKMRSGGVATNDLAKNLTKLRLFTETHFQYEETIMRFAKYPDFDQHRLAHQEMMAKTTKISSQLHTNIQADTDDLFILLKNWWLGHICKEDRAYTPHVKALDL